MRITEKTRKENGAGSIFFDASNNSWIAEIQWTGKDGEKHRKRFSSKKKTVVKNKLEEFKKQLIISSGDIADKDILFEDFANNWLETVLKNKLKPTSYTRKDVTLKNQVFPYIGGFPINKITHSDIQDMINKLNEKGLSYSTIKKAYEATNSCFKYYRIKTSSTFNPCEGITLPSNKKKNISNIIFFDDDQRELIKNEAVRKYKTGKPVYRLGYAIIVLMYTGMRVGELLALTWDDLDFDNRTINVNKNAVVVKQENDDESHYTIINQNSTKTYSGNRIIPMSEVALNAFKELQKINGDKKYIMSTESGMQTSPRNINRMFHSILNQTGISSKVGLCGVHTLRHTFASMLFKNGCDVKIVSDILGHSDTKITENIYIHLIQQQKVRAIQDIDKYSN